MLSKSFIICLFAVFLLSCKSYGFAQKIDFQSRKIEITNIKSKYSDLGIKPVLSNSSVQSIFIWGTSNKIDSSLIYLDKINEEWQHYSVLGFCGNEFFGIKEIKPGEKYDLYLDLGTQQLFNSNPLPQTKYKINLMYFLERPDNNSQAPFFIVESKPFLLNLPKQRPTNKSLDERH